MSRLFEICIQLQSGKQSDIIDKLIEELNMIKNEEQTENTTLDYLYSL